MALSCLSHVKRTDETKKRPIAPTIINSKLIIDRSGSMISCGEGPSIGLREYLKAQRKMAEEGSEVIVQVVTFDNEKEIPFHGNANTITDEIIQQCIDSIVPRNTTRFFDTLAETIYQQQEEIKDIMDNRTPIQKKLDVKVSGSLAIITDGCDNASYKHDIYTIKALVENHRKKHNIMCQFIAANMDALNTGESYGFAQENSLQMGNNPQNAMAAMMAITSSQERQYSGNAIPSFTPLERQTSCDTNSIHPNINNYFGSFYDMDSDDDLYLVPPKPALLKRSR